MLTREEARRLVNKVVKFSSFPECSASMSESEQSFVRFAGNGVSTAGFTVERTVTVQVTRENRTGISRTTDLSDGSLRAAVRRAEQLAAISPPNPEHMPAFGPQKYAEYENFDEQTALARAPDMVPQVKAIIDHAVADKLVGAGFFERSASVDAFANSAGNFGYQRSADARLTTTVRRHDGSSSGWAGQPATRLRDISGADLGARAVEKCLRWKKPRRIEPGPYTVVLEPTAAADLTGLIGVGFQARSTEEGRTFLSRKGGGTLVGEKLFPESITLRSDPFDQRLPTRLWSQQEIPSRKVVWIDEGVVKNPSYDRYWAARTGQQPTPSPFPLILNGGTDTLADLVKATDLGLLVTRFWYIRSVNPQTLQFTGLTRDGVFLIEKGEVTEPVMNLRFNESPVRLLQNTRRLGRMERVRGAEGPGMIVPALQVADFTFTSISDAV